VKKPPKWEPTPAAYLGYLAREQLQARENVEAMLREGISSHDTLHSRATIHRAWQHTLSLRPNRFARDPRRFSSTPRPKEVPT
jgi:hypothetical protein